MSESYGQAKRRGTKLVLELGLGFACIVLVALVMATLLVLLLRDVSGFVGSMQRDESAIRHSQALATAVREHALVIARSSLHPQQPGVLERYEQRFEKLQREIDAVQPYAPAVDAGRVDELRTLVAKIDLGFRDGLATAVASDDRANMLARLTELEAASEAAKTHADALAAAIESRMAHAHTRATDSTQLGLLVGGSGILVMLVLSTAFTLRIRRALIVPLRHLYAAARSIALGDFALRLGAVGRGELQVVAEAFDEMAEELAAREVRIIEAERMAALGQLAAGIAHEINNPISIIRGYLGTMNAYGDPEVLAEELAILDEEASQCQRIAEDLLVSARSPQLALSSLSMASFLNDHIERMRGNILPVDLDVDVDVEDAEIQADSTRLRQVLSNLVLNAVQASGPSVDLDVDAISIVGKSVCSSYEIRVCDRGPGVPEEDRERVFELFHSRRRGGSGLGLPVCRGIVKAHGGSIDCAAREGGGTCFRVRLPRIVGSQADAEGEERRMS